jgi:2,4-dienoyl-CoA reductase-like NADH-dependent reductase (Old Yellow Enzyme family)/thioredoxin reductase
MKKQYPEKNIRESRLLFQPGNIGTLQLGNRLIIAAMGNSLASNDGKVTDTMLDYYKARARGGVGMVITQFVSVNQEDVMPYNLCLYDDSFIEGISKLVRTIHEQGSFACIQLMHPGMLLLMLKSIPHGVTIKVPGITGRMTGGHPYQAIEIKDIEKYILDFSAAAYRARETGADAVEIHACHGCLLSTFLSPALNCRTDSYGGNVQNRTRFARLIVEQVKEKLGHDFPVIVKINGTDDIAGGVSSTEVVQQAGILNSAGADAISISSGLEYWSTLMSPSYLSPEGIVVPVAKKIKDQFKIPVIVAGKISSALAENIIENDQADFISIGRPLLADPELPSKLRQRKEESIARCLYCNNCLRTSWRSCTVNPFLWREAASTISVASQVKKVMVIGGGLAGLEAAVLCKRRGHDVFLFEKESELGGQWNIACAIPGKHEYASILTHLKHLLEILHIPVQLNKEVNRKLVMEVKPDVIIVAAGAVPARLDLPGMAGQNIIQANDVILGKRDVRGHVTVIGGNIMAMETAILLAEQGKLVSLVSRSNLGGRKGPDDMITFRGLLRRIVGLRIALYLNAEIIEMSENFLVIGWGGEIISVPSDMVILAIGVRSADKLIGEIKGLAPEIYPVGDCMMPGNAAQAIYSAARLALKL